MKLPDKFLFILKQEKKQYAKSISLSILLSLPGKRQVLENKDGNYRIIVMFQRFGDGTYIQQSIVLNIICYISLYFYFTIVKRKWVMYNLYDSYIFGRIQWNQDRKKRERGAI